MECIEARAFKSSALKKIAMKSNQQVFFDDVWCLAGLNNVGSDDFSVDDLLDFSDKDFSESRSSLDSEEVEGRKSSFSLVSPHHRNYNSQTFSGTEDFGSLSTGQFLLPVDDMENLEWLSRIVDDSSSELSLFCPNPSFQPATGTFLENRCEPVIIQAAQNIKPPLPVPVQRKQRSKRSRLSGKVWSYVAPSLTSESSSPSSSYGSSSLPGMSCANPVHDGDLFSSVEKPPAKKLKRKSSVETGPGSGVTQTLRRCSHCQVQKTPQWRTGPMGPKTLCNACGVRYKSGRLFPEYRPACSPTFSLEIHSNSHRKVLEMRRKKEDTEVIDAGSGSGSTTPALVENFQ
ncbi:PREDICTED: GATA transcription factor 5-like [Ipomoea nil]|uniref:GATA transcription factor 5-like n=1 Tax=Ipomoea nil TaxID=35883 RepID=UPI000900C2BC|nr:PREDICTED: GATA transcription factor 5-like [Ipomoea nil]